MGLHNFWEIMQQHNVTYLQVVPTILIMILNTPTSFRSFEALNLKYIGCGSAPLASEIQTQFQERFSLPVSNLYGLSESGPSHFDNTQEKGWKPGSIGKPLDVNQCIIFKDNFEPAKPNEVGEIALKGENIFNGYYKNEEATKKAMYGEYFLTGDLGYYDDKGYFYFVDRSKDLIIKAGVNIFPGEIEEIITTLDEVEMVAVTGIPNKILGEDIAVFIKIKSGEVITKERVLEICNANLQPIKIPTSVEFVEQMPTTPSGKIIKRALTDNG
jgi:long-chain acyl-CoA synthetase